MRSFATGAVAELVAGSRLRLSLEPSVPRLLGAAGYRVRSSPWGQRRLQLYDTADGRLAAAGAELFSSPREGWTWRRSGLGHPKLGAREWLAPALTPTDRLMEWTRAYRRGEPLDARATVLLRRRSHQVGDDRSDDLLTLDEERYDEQVGGRWTPRVRRLVVRETAAGRAAARAVAPLQEAALADAPILALLDPGLVRAPMLKLPAVDSTGVRDLFMRSAGLSVIQWLYLDCEVSGGGAVEALRKMRVALRRLRSDLQTFAPLLERAWAEALREQLGVMAGRLGVVRDAEVLVDRLGSLLPFVPEADQQPAQALVDVAGEQLAGARAELLDTLATEGYLAALDGALGAATAPRWADPEGDGSLPVVTQLARRPWRRLRDHAASLDALPGDAQLHRMRILAKRARYAADACAPAVGRPAAASAQHLADLQTVLGDHHDAAVTSGWLRRQADASTELAFAAGQMAGLELQRLEEAQEAWPAALAAASRRQGWRWLRS